MTTYLLSFAAGLFIGVTYYVLGVRSPAPPIVALLGLLGILIGEQALPIFKDHFFPKSQNTEIGSSASVPTTNTASQRTFEGDIQ